MAVDLTIANGDYLSVASSPVTDHPIQMSVWWNPDTTNEDSIGGIGTNGGGVYVQFIQRSAANGQVLRFRTDYGGTARNANTVNTYTTGAWNHAFGESLANNNRSAVLNGDWANADLNDTTNSTGTPTFDQIALGTAPQTLSANMDGAFAEFAIWSDSTAFTQPEVEALADGVDPRLIRPATLLFYAPLIRDVSAGNWPDIVQGRILTEAGTSVTPVAHPPIIYPAPRFTITAPSAAITAALTGTVVPTVTEAAIVSG